MRLTISWNPSRYGTLLPRLCMGRDRTFPLWKSAMSYLQDGIDQLSSVAALPLIAVLFLIASILGWYVGSLIQWLRH